MSRLVSDLWNELARAPSTRVSRCLVSVPGDRVLTDQAPLRELRINARYFLTRQAQRIFDLSAISFPRGAPGFRTARWCPPFSNLHAEARCWPGRPGLR